MRLRASPPKRLLFYSPPRVGSLAFIGAAIAAIGALALIAPGPVTTMRTGTALVFAAVAALLVRLAVRPPFRAELDGDRRQLRHGRTHVALGQTPRIQLSAGGGDVRRMRLTYSASLVLESQSFLLLEDPDPARVLSDLRSVVREVPLQVEAGWGLPARAVSGPEGAFQPLPSPTPGRHFTASFRSNPRQAAWTVGLTGVIIGLVMASSVIERVSAGEPATLVSYAAPMAVITAILVMAAAMLSVRTRLHYDGEFVMERAVLGISLQRTRAPGSALRGIYAVGPGDRKLHVILDFGESVVSLPCPAGDAEPRAREIEAAIRMAQPPVGPAP